MRHRKKGKILSRKRAHRQAMLANLAASLILYEKIDTTLAKAKVLRPFIERIITKAKQGDLASRRQLLKVLPVKRAVNKCLEVIGPKYKDRQGGYVRIIRLGSRRGDGAEIARIELV